jgi:hypothetical protein
MRCENREGTNRVVNLSEQQGQLRVVEQVQGLRMEQRLRVLGRVKLGQMMQQQVLVKQLW